MQEEKKQSKIKVPLIIVRINEYLAKDEKNVSSLSDKTGVHPGIIKSIVGGKRKKYRTTTLDILYEHFGLEKDEYYRQNMKRWVMPSESILGAILRARRIQMGYSLDDIARMLKGEVRQLARLEAGDSLPAYQSYYISKLLPLYQFSVDEQEKIKWYICILRDVCRIYNKYSPTPNNDIEKKL